MKIITAILVLFLPTLIVCGQDFFAGPLKKNAANGRYFTDNSGDAIYLTGSHTWENFQDMATVSDSVFDYGAYLNMMANHHHNFMRLWVWEQPQMVPWSSEYLHQSLTFSTHGSRTWK